MSVQPPSPKIHPAIATGIIILCALVLAGFLWPIRRLAGEVLLLGFIFLLFRYSLPMTNWLRGIPRTHCFIFSALILFVVAGHFTFDNRADFPFVAWQIFPVVREEDPVSCRELRAVTDKGKNVRLLVEQIFPSIVQFDLPSGDDSQATEHLVRALAHQYDQLHPGDGLRRVDLLRVLVPLHSANGRPSCEFLKRFDVSSDR